MFGSIFFLTQFLQTVQGYSPLQAGIRVLPWTAITMVLAPVVGQLAERWGGKPLVVTGLVLQATGLAWLAIILTPTTPYADLVAPFVVCGVGMTLFFVPLASVVLGTLPKALEGVASGANAAFRELGGVLGIAVLGAVFSCPGRLRLGPGLRVGPGARRGRGGRRGGRRRRVCAGAPPRSPRLQAPVALADVPGAGRRRRPSRSSA